MSKRFTEEQLVKDLLNPDKIEVKSLRQCKQCNEYKVKISVGKFPDGRNTRFEDNFGKQWNGRTCPDCFLLVMQDRMKTKRVK